MDSPYIIKFFSYFEDPGAIYHIYEFLPGKDLFEKIKDNDGLEESQAVKYMKRICQGIDYMHENYIMHRDIKPENIMLDEKGNPKIIDFSYAVSFRKKKKFIRLLGSLYYLPPEMLENKLYDQRVDIWSLGILFYEMLTGYPPFDADSSQEIVDQILDDRVQYPGHVSLQASCVIDIILGKNPEYRPTLKGILQMLNLYFKS